jgi:hypothetical protein
MEFLTPQPHVSMTLTGDGTDNASTITKNITEISPKFGQFYEETHDEQTGNRDSQNMGS